MDQLDDGEADSEQSSHLPPPPPSRASLRLLYAQIASLCQRALLLPFRQHNTTYYSIPLAVRACLSPFPAMVSRYPEDKAATLNVRTRSPAELILTLYAVWDALDAASIPRNRRRAVRGAKIGPSGFLVRSAAPPRQPIEDEWAPLQGWNHLPSEIQGLAWSKPLPIPRPYVRPGYYGERKTFAGPVSQSLTVPAPEYRLCSADRAALQHRLALADEELEFYYALLEGLGTVAGGPGQPVTAHMDQIARLLSLPLPTQVATIVQSWAETTAWSEMDAVLRRNTAPEPPHAESSGVEPERLRLRRNLAYTEFKAADLYEEWRAGRKAVLRFLSLLAEGCWFSTVGLLQTVFEVNSNLYHAHSAPSVWWVESVRSRKQFGTTFDDWLQSYGQCVLALLEGPLAWLGLVSLGYADGKPEAFRLESIGAFVLGRRSTLPEADLAPHLIPGQGESSQPMGSPAPSFGDDLSIALVPHLAPPELHALLRTVGELESIAPQRFVYRLTAEGIRRWSEAAPAAGAADAPTGPDQTRETPETPLSLGCDDLAARLIAQLERLSRVVHAQAVVPAAWQDKLRAWCQNYGKFHIYEDIALVELADEYAVQELLASTSLREHVIYQFSPCLIAVRPAAIDVLVHEMESRGYTPRVE